MIFKKSKGMPNQRIFKKMKIIVNNFKSTKQNESPLSKIVAKMLLCAQNALKREG